MQPFGDGWVMLQYVGAGGRQVPLHPPVLPEHKWQASRVVPLMPPLLSRSAMRRIARRGWARHDPKGHLEISP